MVCTHTATTPPCVCPPRWRRPAAARGARTFTPAHGGTRRSPHLPPTTPQKAIDFKFTEKRDYAPALRKYFATLPGETGSKLEASVVAFQSMRNDVASIQVANDGAREALLR